MPKPTTLTMAMVLAAGCGGLPRVPTPARARAMILGQALPERVDVILVHGCPARPDGTASTCNRRRARAALRAFAEKRAPLVMFTGGPTLNRISEARVMAEVAVEEGLPREAVLLEEESRHTVTNLWVGKGIMKKRGLRTALLVSDAMHLVWAKHLADSYRMQTWLYPADPLPPWSDEYLAREPFDEFEPWRAQTAAYGRPQGRAR